MTKTNQAGTGLKVINRSKAVNNLVEYEDRN